MNAWLGTPTHGEAFMLGPVGPDLCGAGDAELSGRVARIRDHDTPLAGHFGYRGQFVHEIVAIRFGQLEGFGFTPAFPVTEELGVSLAVPITANEPTVSGSGINSADSFICFRFWHGV